MISLELLTQLSEEYPNGVSFEPLALRILCQKMSLDETQVETLKTELFQMKNGLWYHGNMILSIERQSLFEEKIQEYFESSKLFSVEQLLDIFKNTLRHVKNVQDCALFLQYLGYSVEVWHRKHHLCVASRHTYVNVLESISHSIFKYLESSNGTVSKEDICEKLPQFSVEVLDDIRTVFLPNVLETEISDTICWSTADALILPDDFSEKLTDIVDTLVDIGKSASVVNISFALDLTYKIRFRNEYLIEDDDTFKKICIKSYKGEHCLFSRTKTVKQSIQDENSGILGLSGSILSLATWKAYKRDGTNPIAAVLSKRRGVGESWEQLSLEFGYAKSTIRMMVTNYDLYLKVCKLNDICPEGKDNV